jgi:HD-like signal output (HDOD) protein
MSDSTTNGNPADLAVIVRGDGKSQKLIANFLKVLLNYQYGLEVEVVSDLIKASQILRKDGERIRSFFIVQDRALNVSSTLPLLTAQGEKPVVVLYPAELLERERDACLEVDNVYLCAWEMAFGKQSFTLTRLVEIAFEENGIGTLEGDVESTLEARLDRMAALPTLPGVVLRIIRLMRDPATTMDDLEQLLISDPAIVLKIMEAINSPSFAGGSRSSEWTLKDALVRMGLRQVGAIAQQIALVNCFVKPQESSFDLRRFWAHSLGTAVVADRIYTSKLVQFEEEISYNDYWLASLLHDSGKLVLGLFFWDWFAQVVEKMQQDKLTFQQAEAQLSDAIDHERIGELLLIKATMGEGVIEAVGLHHATGDDPSALVCLVHLANNVCKELGLGYLSEEKVVYSKSVLKKLRLKRSSVTAVKESLGDTFTEEIAEMVRQFLGS